MTSIYSEYGWLSQQTIDAYHRCVHPQDIEDRVNFYLTYLYDVVPYGVTVHSVPNHLQPWNIQGYTGIKRMEIALRTDQGVFMTCIVSVEGNQHCEVMAATLANDHWHRGHVVPFHHQAWGMFTCQREIKFFSSDNGTEWDHTATMNPITDVREVVAYLRREYERISHN